jgi:glycosyltransferase involved in cell wall biosynthesis
MNGLMKVVILATRIAGTDGVSLEAVRWQEILKSMGHDVTLVAGKLDKEGICIPELHFQWPRAFLLHEKVIFGNNRYEEVEAEIFEAAGLIEGKLRETFNHGREVDLLIVPNAFSIPMHFPLAVALARIIEEIKIPTIARHHDFWWERERFAKSTMFAFFKRWFPPQLATLKHVVVNSIAKKELEKRTGIKAELIPDTFNFNSKLDKLDSYSRNWRGDFGIAESDLVFLQPTRIVPRKRIEISIDFIKKLDDPRAVLVIAGYAGDEGKDYERDVHRHAMKARIRFLTIGDYVDSERRMFKVANNFSHKEHRIYSLWDCFANADFVTYPTKTEGFGNQFVETMYFKKPIIITPYPVFRKDIAPLGFKTVSMPGKVTKTAINQVKELVEDDKKRKGMVEFNFDLANENYDYSIVEKKLRKIFKSMGLV